MVVREDGRNIPNAVGRANIPPQKSWGLLRPIANLPSIIPEGLDRSFLPQLVARRPLLSWAKARAGLPILGVLRAQWVSGVETEWPEGADIAKLPSVIGILFGGDQRSLHPQGSKAYSKDLCIEL